MIRTGRRTDYVRLRVYASHVCASHAYLSTSRREIDPELTRNRVDAIRIRVTRKLRRFSAACLETHASYARDKREKRINHTHKCNVNIFSPSILKEGDKCGKTRHVSPERAPRFSFRRRGQRELTLMGIDAWIYSRLGGEYNRIVFEGPTGPRGQPRGPLTGRRASVKELEEQRPPCLRVARYALLQPAISSLSVSISMPDRPASLRTSCDLGCATEPEYQVVPATLILAGCDDDREINIRALKRYTEKKSLVVPNVK